MRQMRYLRYLAPDRRRKSVTKLLKFNYLIWLAVHAIYRFLYEIPIVLPQSIGANMPQKTVFIRLTEVIKLTGLSRSSIYAMLDPNSPQFDPTFPRQVKLSVRSVAWSSTELENWVLSRLEARPILLI